ncbi:MAG: YggT family protein [Pseudomonadota bacterium]
MNAILYFLIWMLSAYLWLIICNVLASWLVAFDVLNTRNRWVFKACGLLNKLTDPGMVRLRRFVPPMGNLDWTPMVMILMIYLLQSFLYGLIS